MTTIELTSAGAFVFAFGMHLKPNEARELARKLIDGAHECDKHNRRLRYPKAILDTNDLARYVAEHDAR